MIFVVPDTPDPHWRVGDAKGNVYDLDKLKKKSLGDKYQKKVVLPAYVKNVQSDYLVRLSRGQSGRSLLFQPGSMKLPVGAQIKA